MLSLPGIELLWSFLADNNQPHEPKCLIEKYLTTTFIKDTRNIKKNKMTVLKVKTIWDIGYTFSKQGGKNV
jgi:hypothetical protein